MDNTTNPMPSVPADDAHESGDAPAGSVSPPEAKVEGDGTPPADNAQPSGDGAGRRRRDERSAPREPAEATQADAGQRFAAVVSGEFDADEEVPDDEAVMVKRVLAPQPETPKLHKVLAQAGMGSRLEMEQLIMEGRISVNNEPAHIGQRIQFGDQIKVNGKPIKVRIEPPPARVIAYHKPVGEVVTHDDPQNRPTVFRKLPKLYQGKWQSVGRLDLNTEGLLLFTSSGDLANRLMHPRFGLEREYAVRVLGALSNEEKQRLLDGVRLDDGQAQFQSIEDGGGEGSNCWYRVTIAEGRNREVRRLFEAVGHAVSRLIRIRYGAMVLPRGLKRGAWMELDDADIRALMRAVGQRPGAAGQESFNAAGGGPKGGPGGRNRRRNGAGGAANAPRQASGGGGRGKGGTRSGAGTEAQPDPMRTSLGYIGSDSFNRQRQEPRRSGGGGAGGGRRGGRGR